MRKHSRTHPTPPLATSQFSVALTHRSRWHTERVMCNLVMTSPRIKKKKKSWGRKETSRIVSFHLFTSSEMLAVKSQRVRFCGSGQNSHQDSWLSRKSHFQPRSCAITDQLSSFTQLTFLCSFWNSREIAGSQRFIFWNLILWYSPKCSAIQPIKELLTWVE